MLAGALLQKLLDAARLGQFVDRRTMVRIGSSVSDYLIAFAIASIQMNIVVKYAIPLTIMVIFGIAYSVGLLWFIGRRIFRNFWFERSIFVYGWNTGVVAMGITLLRIVDPKVKTSTLQDFGLAYVFLSIVEICLITFIPQLVAKEIITVPALLLTVGFVGCILLSRLLVGWFPYASDKLREGEINDER